jgi:hypothetical protein
VRVLLILGICSPIYVHALTALPVVHHIPGVPPVYQTQPDPRNPSKFLKFTDQGCAVVFAGSSNLGMTWSGSCVDGRIEGNGTLIGWNDEQQPLFCYQGTASRGVRFNGTDHSFGKINGNLGGYRTLVVDGVRQDEVAIGLFGLPRPLLDAIDVYFLTTEGKGIYSSVVASQKAEENRALANQLAGALLAAAAANNSNSYGDQPIAAQNLPQANMPLQPTQIASNSINQPKSYLDEKTGEKCVKTIPNDPTYPYQPSKTLGYIYLKNSCGRTFGITATFKNGNVKSNGIQPYGKSHIACDRARGECDGEASIELR